MSPTLLKFKKDISEFEPEKSIASFPILVKLLLIILPLLKSISIASCFVFLNIAFSIKYFEEIILTASSESIFLKTEFFISTFV